jgi:hypothetical protein
MATQLAASPADDSTLDSHSRRKALLASGVGLGSCGQEMRMARR